MRRGLLPRRDRGRLRVHVPESLARVSPGTGHGNVWRRVLPRLEQAGARLVSAGAADVHLSNAHEPPPGGRPLVVLAYEASWRDPSLAPVLDEGFAANIDAHTRESLHAAAHVITISAASARQIVTGYGVVPERVHPVLLGVDANVFRPRSSLAELEGAPYVLNVAVLHPRKNLAAVRSAVAALAEAGLPHRLVLVGGAPPDPRAARFAAEATAELPGHPGRVRHLRDVSEVRLAELMAGASVFCLPSLFEGFGLPVLEAMASGAPVVVSDRGALPEVVGEAGLAVAPDAESVSGAVRRVIDHPDEAARLRAAGLRRAAELTWERTAAGWLEVLRRAAEGR